ncbi:hypothetical protein ACQ7B2_00860, partial [Escherichia coli]
FGTQSIHDPSASDLQRLARGGAGSFRVNVDWRGVEPTRGARQWSRYDTVMARAAQARLDVVAVIVGSPSFATHDSRQPPRSGQARSAY